MDLKLVILIIFLFLCQNIKKSESTLLLLDCPSEEKQCQILLSCSDKDAKWMAAAFYMVEEQLEAENGEGTISQEHRVKRQLEAFVGIGLGIGSQLLLDYFKPKHTLYINTDGILSLSTKRFRLLQAEQELLFNRLVTNLSDEVKCELFKEYPALRLNDLDSDGKINEVTGPHRKSSIPCSSGKQYAEGSYERVGEEAAADDEGALIIGPGGSPPTKPPGPSTTPTPQPVIDLDSDGNSGSESEYKEDREAIEFPPWIEPARCYPPYNTGSLITDPSGLTFVRGPRWGTYGELTGIKNSCNIDPFFAHMGIMADQYPDYAEAFIRLHPDSPGFQSEATLRGILGFWNMELAHEESDPQAIDRRLKRTWVEGTGLRIIYPRPVITEDNRDRILDLKGDEWQNIFGQLSASSTLAFAHKCSCENGYQHVFLSPGDRFTPDILNNLNTPQGRPTKISKRKCNRCHKPFQYQYARVGPATWMIPFAIENPRERPLSWPTTLQFQVEEVRAIGSAYFDLGYIGFSTIDRSTGRQAHVTHHTSLHLFGGNWYYYNDMENEGRLTLVANPNTFIAVRDLHTTSVVYFRRNPHRPARGPCVKRGPAGKILNQTPNPLQ